MINEDVCHEIIAILVDRAQKTPNKTAYVYLQNGSEALELNYATLLDRVRKVAKEIMLHSQSGERVVLLYPSGLDFLIAFLACLYSGVVAIPVYPPRNVRHWGRIRKVLNDADSSCLLTTETSLVKLNDWLQLEDLKELDACRVMATDLSYKEPDAKIISITSRYDEIALLQYTSGSTSDPKGVIVSGENLLCNLDILCSALDFNEESRQLSWMPHYHDMGLICGYIMPLYIGVKGYLMAPATFIQTPMLWLTALSKYRITHSFAPNFALDLAVSTLERFKRNNPAGLLELDLSNWRSLLNGAEPIRVSSVEAFADAFKPFGYRPEAQMPGYGMAESTLMVTDSGIKKMLVIKSFDPVSLRQGCAVESLDGNAGQRLVSSGRAASGVDIAIVNPVTGERLEAWHIGEIWLAGKTITSGYWADDAKTKSTYGIALGFAGRGEYLRTGDVGFLDSDGELFVNGRLKDVIIVDGNNYYPQDIELMAAQSHSALEADGGAAFGLYDDGLERLVLIQEVKRTERNNLDLEEVFAAVASTISEELGLSLSRLVLVRPGSIDKTSSGKIQRSLSKQKLLNQELKVFADLDPHILYGGESKERAEADAGAFELKSWLRSQIAELLEIPSAEVSSIKFDRPLKEYGLNSRQSVGLTGRLSERLNQPLDPTVLYQYSTINALCDHLISPAKHNEPLPVGEVNKHSSRIAIVAMSCRFPGASNIDEYWQLLLNNQHSVSKRLDERWSDALLKDYGSVEKNKLNTAGFLDNVTGFDADFFGISAREANSMDPQQRLLMALSWEAIESAGFTREALSGSNTGVFVGISTHDYDALAGSALENISAYQASGNAHSIAANRLSYFFDFKGPSMAIDTACSSSLVAIHQACRSLQAGDCDQALVGGVNLILSPDVAVGLSQANMLSPTGACRTFSAEADGYVRAEGGAVLMLQPLDVAQAQGNRVLAVIEGSALNQDGRSNGLTAPNGLAQEEVITQALKAAHKTIDDISFFEAHGTGTPLGDPIEVGALKRLMSQGSGARKRKCLVGSAKSNIGHLEAAAGLAGLIKSVLSLHYKMLPSTINCQQLNPMIELGDNLAIAQKNTCLSTQSGSSKTSNTEFSEPLFAGVSAFSFGGANAHVILGRADDTLPSRQSSYVVQENRPLLIPVSANTPKALLMRIEQLLAFVGENDVQLALLASQLIHNRDHLSHRITLSCCHVDEFVEKLTLAAEALRQELAWSSKTRDIDVTAGHVFVFSGQGNQWLGMGQELRASSSVFNRALNSIDQLVQKHAGWSVVEQLEKESLTDQTRFIQPMIFALQVATADYLRQCGVLPSAVVGHSMGEVAAAYVAGKISLDTAVRVILGRGEVMHDAHGKGGMLALRMSAQAVEELIVISGFSVEVAADNSALACVVSGDNGAIENFSHYLMQNNIEFHRMAMPYAFHSANMAPLESVLIGKLAKVDGLSSSVDMFSTSAGDGVTSTYYDARYWANNIRNTVHFKQAIERAVSEGYRNFIEIGPGAILSPVIQANLRGLSQSGFTMATLIKSNSREGLKVPALSQLHKVLARSYEHDGVLDWTLINEDAIADINIAAAPTYQLPTYPWQQQTFWYPHLQQVMPVELPTLPEIDNEAVYRPIIFQQWPLIVKEIQRQSTYLPMDLSLDKCEQSWDNLNDYAVYSMAVALVKIDGKGLLKQGVTVKRFIDKTDIKNDYLPLVERWLDHLSNVGILHTSTHVDEDSFDKQYFLNEGASSLDENRFKAQIKCAEYFDGDDGEFLFNYLEHCDRQLTQTLIGEFNPLELLFPQGSLELVEKLYHDWPLVQYFNSIAVRSCLRYLSVLANQKKSKKPLRILEVGAGTGGLTRSLIPSLAENFSNVSDAPIEYYFSDVTPMFFERAKALFAEYDFVTFKAINLETPLAPQLEDLDEALFDIVLGANVLHAVSDLKQTFAQLNSVMRSGAMILLYELTNAQPWVDMSIGLIEGWGVFDDGIRTNTPLLSSKIWMDLLEGCGFESGHSFPEKHSAASVLGQHVIVAQKCHDADQSMSKARLANACAYFIDWQECNEESPPQVVSTQKILLLRRSSPACDAQVQALEALGHRVWLVDLSSDYRGFNQTQQSISLSLDDPLAWSSIFDLVLHEEISHCVFWADDTVTYSVTDTLLVLSVMFSVINQKHILLDSFILATHSSQKISDQDNNIIHPEGAALWAFGRVVNREFTRIPLRLVDFDERSNGVNNLAVLLQKNTSSKAPMKHRVYRNNITFEPVLVPLQASLMGDYNPVQQVLEGDGSYLVVGGFGVLGIETVGRLIAMGARSLVLTSRTAIQKALENSDLFEHWKRSGVQIDVVDLDVGDGNIDKIFGTLRKIEAELTHPIKGVIQLAGDLQGSLIERVDMDHIDDVMSAKAKGSQCLLEYFERYSRPLDFFIMFGSAASVLAPQGQAIYAAANGFQSGLSHQARMGGLNALTLSWGVWEKAGVAAQKVVDLVNRHGVQTIELQAGMDMLEWSISMLKNHPADRSLFPADIFVIPGPLDDLLKIIPELERDGLIQNLFARHEEVGSEVLAVNYNHEEIDMFNGANRSVLDWLTLEVANLMATSVESLKLRKPLIEQGFDSLMAVTLKSRIEADFRVVIRTVDIIQGASVESLVYDIQQQFEPDVMDDSREVIEI